MSLYTKIIRPILYRFSPDTIHPIVATGSELAARTPVVGHTLRRVLRVQSPALRTTVDGVQYENPIGLSAGFDKDGKNLHFAYTFGFGFMEVGSVTKRPYRGNPKPWARRLVHNESLVVNYGLKSQGVHRVAQRLAQTHVPMPYGVSIAKSNQPDCIGQVAITDYVDTYIQLKEVGAYATINLSCPNTADGTPFSNPQALEPLLHALHAAREQHGITKPTYLKISPETSDAELERIIALTERYGMQGLVIGNLLKDKERARALLPRPQEYNPAWPGSLSGAPIRNLATDCIRRAYQRTQGKLTIIGTGGIFTGDHAYEKIRAGANLVQLITGFIFGGPTTIRNVNRQLLELLKRDGFSNVSQAVGADYR